METALLRYKRAFAKANVENRRLHPNNTPRFPERPSGMHGETFVELLTDVDQARAEWHQVMEVRLRALSSNYDYNWPNEPLL
jgi:hypothetical protein